MTNKETKIREAWVVEIGEEKYNEIENEIDENGWISNQELHKSIIRNVARNFHFGKYGIRIRSLQNIEDNRGWNRIDEVGLPSEEGYYLLGWFGDNKKFYQADSPIEFKEAIEYLKREVFTHWRKKEVYPNPIY